MSAAARLFVFLPKPLKQLLRSCRDGGIPSHPVDSGEFKRLPGWDHQLTMCNTEYFNVTWNKNGSELYTGSAPADYSTSIIGNGASSNSNSQRQSAAISRGSDAERCCQQRRCNSCTTSRRGWVAGSPFTSSPASERPTTP